VKKDCLGFLLFWWGFLGDCLDFLVCWSTASSSIFFFSGVSVSIQQTPFGWPLVVAFLGQALGCGIIKAGKTLSFKVQVIPESWGAPPSSSNDSKSSSLGSNTGLFSGLLVTAQPPRVLGKWPKNLWKIEICSECRAELRQWIGTIWKMTLWLFACYSNQINGHVSILNSWSTFLRP
jgi:hypothetical protein